MNDTDTKRLEAIEAPHRGACFEDCPVCFLISHLKDAMERESRVRELHKPYVDEVKNQLCSECCDEIWPCSTIRLLGEKDGKWFLAALGRCGARGNDMSDYRAPVSDEELRRLLRFMQEHPDLFPPSKPSLYDRIEAWRKQFDTYGKYDSGDYRGDESAQYYQGMASGLTIALQEIDLKRYEASHRQAEPGAEGFPHIIHYGQGRTGT